MLEISYRPLSVDRGGKESGLSGGKALGSARFLVDHQSVLDYWIIRFRKEVRRMGKMLFACS